MSPDTTALLTSIKDNILDIMFYVIGAICFFVGIKNLLSKKNMSQKWGSAIYWIGLGIALGFGKQIQATFNNAYPIDGKPGTVGNTIVGAIVVLLTIPAIINKVFPGDNKAPSAKEAMEKSNKIGYKIFIPALTIGVVSLIIAILIPTIGAIAGLGVGVFLAAIIIVVMSKDSPVEMLNGGKRLLEVVGPLSLLPQLLACLGAVFTAAGVGTVIANIVGTVVPKGNVTVGIIIYAIGMALFTMIMGNAFAAFSVMTVGIGIPFVLNYGLNPNVIGMLALTSGYCGTLMTPMAANFNIVPVAVLEMKDKYGVIKNQIFIALTMLVIQIIMMNIMGYMK